jgi:hypothetical protein
MPHFNGTGPREFGLRSGRGMGRCGGGRAYGNGPGNRCGFGGGRGFGFGRGQGFGRGPGAGFGWASVGYGEEGDASMRAALESRRDFLRAELARTDALLAKDEPNTNPQGAGKDAE